MLKSGLPTSIFSQILPVSSEHLSSLESLLEEDTEEAGGTGNTTFVVP